MKRPYITLEEVKQIVNYVNDFVFIETDGKKQYHPEYLTVAANYCKLLYFNPDEVKSENIEAFYEDCQKGEYNDILRHYSLNPQWEEINKYIEQKVAYTLSQMTNPFNLALAELADTVNGILIRNEKKMDGVDFNKFADSIATFGENLNMEELVKAVVDKVKSEPVDDDNVGGVGTVKKSKSTTKTNSTKTTRKKSSAKSNLQLAPKSEDVENDNTKIDTEK